MAVLRLFAAAREAAGVARAEFDGATVADLLEAARGSFGDRFSAVLERSRVWVNGEPATPETVVNGHDVVAVLPPVSGGAGDVMVVAVRPPVSDPGERPLVPSSDRPASRGPAGPGGTAAKEAVRGPAGLGGTAAPARPSGTAAETSPDLAAAKADEGPAPATGDSGHPGEPGGGPATAGRKRWALARLAVVHDSARPHGRIGVAWAVVTVAATILGPPWLAAWLALAAFAGASQTAACRRALDQRPPPGLAALVAGALPFAAVFGARYVVEGVTIGLGGALLARTLVTDRRLAANLSLALLIGVVTGTAAAATVLARAVSVEAALFLLACACIYDAGAYLIGTGASSAWEGPTAGIVALIPVTILAAVILVPPFPSGTPLALGLLAAVLAPLGPLAGTALLGGQEADAPGLRRLDSLILLAPAWAWLVTTILQ